MPALETVKLEGVSVMAAGGPYRGKGSPPAGDFFDVAKLQQIADASNALHDAGELRPVNKIGHDPNQQLLRDSGISDGERPAAGWLRNFRVDGNKLKADIENVPKKLADLIKAGAYRTRSAELRTLESQTGGQARGPAVTGLAWLGAVGPAIRNLDDIYAYYADYEIDEDVIVVDYSEEPPPWNPDRGFRWVQAQIDAQLPEDDTTFYVADVGPENALVVEYRYNPSQKRERDGKWTDGGFGGSPVRRERGSGNTNAAAHAQLKSVEKEIERKEGLKAAAKTAAAKDTLEEQLRALRKRRTTLKAAAGGKPNARPSDRVKSYDEVAWVVDFEITGDKLTLALREDWVLAERSWTEATRDFIEASERAAASAADTSRVSEVTFTEEQVKSFAEALGIDEEDVTAEAITEALEKKPEPSERKYSDEDLAELEKNAALGVSANTQLYEMKRDNLIDTCMSEGRIKPADKDEWVRRYDEASELVAKILVELPKDDESAREFGSDEPGTEELENEERLFGEYADYLGIDDGDRAGVKREGAAA